MSEDADFLFALNMQKRLNAENDETDNDSDIELMKVIPAPKRKVSKYHDNHDEDYLNRTQNLVHPQWETLDPTPDIFAMFGRFDQKFFQSRLKCVTLEWSKRMYSCAGICYQRRNRFGMDVTIRLSEPLLKLRPRKDLVETMLHEMIHAYCFVLNIREGNGGHGPNFKKIMVTINKVAGTNITVYHTFHDEVNLYKQHWWRCNGICQDRGPFFGYVKRTNNRAPGPNDQWWEQHLKSCGGVFMKIKEPEKEPKKEKPSKSSTNKGKNNDGIDLRKYFPPNTTSKESTAKPKNNNSTNISNNKTGVFKVPGPNSVSGSGILVLDPKLKPPIVPPTNKMKPTSSIAAAFPPTSYPGLSSDPFNVSANGTNTKTGNTKRTPPGGNMRNVFGFRDLSDSDDGPSPQASSPRATMSGRGYTLARVSASIKSSPDGIVDRNHLRNVWANRFDDGKRKLNPPNTKLADNVESKRRRLSLDSTGKGNEESALDVPTNKTNENTNKTIEEDDDVVIVQDKEVIIELSDSEGEDFVAPAPVARKKTMTSEERQLVIKQEILDDTIDLRDEDIFLIDDEYDDNQSAIVAATELADTSVIDEFFGEDTMMKEFERENDLVASSSSYHKDPSNDIISCPICMYKMKRSVLEEHLNGCMGIVTKIAPPKVMPKNSRILKPRSSKPPRRTAKNILRDAGYSEADLAGFNSSSSADETDSSINSEANSTQIDLNSSPTEVFETERQRRQRNLFKTTRQCPCCGKEFEEEDLFDHLDDCYGS